MHLKIDKPDAAEANQIKQAFMDCPYVERRKERSAAARKLQPKIIMEVSKRRMNNQSRKEQLTDKPNEEPIMQDYRVPSLFKGIGVRPTVENWMRNMRRRCSSLMLNL